MKRQITCIICPKGCSLEVEINDGKAKVSGHSCPKGEQYGIDECLNPVRTVTSTVRVQNRADMMLSVKTAKPIAKDKIFEIMEIIRNTAVDAPVKIGDIIIPNVFGTDVISTKNID